jgi:imidazolonepropionase-like amidohydrolase
MRSFAPRLPLTRSILVLLAPLALAACDRSAPGPASSTSAPPSAGNATVFEGARVIVGDESTPIENATFVVAGDRFVAVGRSGEVSVPAGARRVSLAGKTVMPAIVDTHTHLSRDRESLIKDLRHRAYFGVAAAMSLGQDNGTDVFEVRAETIPGAALYRLAGRGITAPEPGRSDVPYWVETPEEARAAVREQAALKVDIIKIWVDDRLGTYPKLSPEIYTAAIDEAHKNGLRATAHEYYLADAKALLRAGIDAFAHGIRDMDVDDEIVALFRERPSFVLVPNMPDRGVATDVSWLRGSIPEAQWEELRKAASTDRPEAQAFHAIQARNLKRLSDAGVKIALGTDGNVPWGPHLEMEDMVLAGMTPAQVITASTRNAAEFMRLSNAGTVAAGNSADFVVLAANPLDDIKNTRLIDSVYLRGDAVDREAVRANW